MAVATPNIALRDFCGDGGDAEAVADELHDPGPLHGTGPVIEIKPPQVYRTAIDTGILAEIRSDEGDASGPLRIVPSADDGELVLAVSAIVPA